MVIIVRVRMTLLIALKRSSKVRTANLVSELNWVDIIHPEIKLDKMVK